MGWNGLPVNTGVRPDTAISMRERDPSTLVWSGMDGPRDTHAGSVYLEPCDCRLARKRHRAQQQSGMLGSADRCLLRPVFWMSQSRWMQQRQQRPAAHQRSEWPAILPNPSGLYIWVWMKVIQVIHGL